MTFPLTWIIPKLDVLINCRDKIKMISEPAERESKKDQLEETWYPFKVMSRVVLKDFYELEINFLWKMFTLLFGLANQRQLW